MIPAFEWFLPLNPLAFNRKVVFKKIILAKMLLYFYYFTVCDPGYTLNDDKTECEECPADSWKSEFGYEDCTACRQHSTTNGQRAQTNNTCGLCEFRCCSDEP